MSLLEEVRIQNAYERLVEREEINEFLRLKPEAAKKKLQQMSADIKKAIEKYGEDSKVVLYMRAKKKRFAQAMAESLHEGIKVDKLGPEAKSAFQKISSKKAKKIAVSPFDKTKMYWDVDGTTWFVTMNSMGNQGSTKDFVKKVKSGSIKANLVEGKKECPEGHEWDEKMQECLPSSTGIKEQRKLTQKEWNAFKKKGETIEKKDGKYITMKWHGKDVPVPVVIVEKKDCPEGHEWDEKMQECLPSSTGIKEDALDEKTFSTENAKKLAKIFMKELNLNKVAAQKLAERVSREAKSVALPEGE